MLSLDIVSFFISSAKAAGASGADARPAATSAERSMLFFIEMFLRKIEVALNSLSRRLNTSSSVSRCRKLAFGSRFCDNVVRRSDRTRSNFVTVPPATKATPGNFFEDFRLGQQIRHATPRTVTLGDVAVYNGLFGARFAVQSSEYLPGKIGYPRSPIDDFWCSMWYSARPWPISRSMPSPIWAMPIAAFSKPVYPGDTSRGVGSDRVEGELQQKDRHRLCALTRVRPEW